MKYSHTLLLFHGLAMEPKDMHYYRDKFIHSFPEKKFRFIIPRGGKKKISAWGCKRYNAWFDYYTDDTQIEPTINETQLVNARQKIHTLIKRAIDYHNGDSSKVYLSGMSQGCCIALDAGLTFPKPLGGIIGFKGAVLRKTLSDVKTNQRIWVCHGTLDKTIDYSLATASYRKLKLKGVQVTLFTQKVNHSIKTGIIEQMNEIRSFLI
jgi:phospholipase/carboxylesterase